jgi:catechol 2,3-dioxygenase-like lactoylglutathione lyase family enzyme
MIQLRHVGIYADDLEKLERFYMETFQMKAIVNHAEQRDDLIRDLFGSKDAGVTVTKLITEYGAKTGADDMVELLKAADSPIDLARKKREKITDAPHLAFGVPDFDAAVERLLKNGGTRETAVYTLSGGNRCCFCRDPEYNWIEVIERRNG